MRLKTIQTIYSWTRIVLIAILLSLMYCSVANAQTVEERLSMLEKKITQLEKDNDRMAEEKRLADTKQKYMPQIHGILRGKYEYEPDLDASRFEVRNARLAATGRLPLRSEYKLEVDLCDESAIKMKDAWVRITPVSTARFTIGQQRMPFTIDAHRNPSAQYFANRSFIAKQVGDMRDVGFQAGYDIMGDGKKLMSIDAGIFNGSNLDNQKTAWFSSPGYSARIQYYPVKGLAIVPSIQHQQIAERKASYTSLDFGSYYEACGWHIEAEFLHKSYGDDAFSDCNALNTMLIYKHPIRKAESLVESVSFLGRYDYMQAHSSGKDGMDDDAIHLKMTDAERHRMTLGTTISIRNPYFPTDIRLNYEKYWYPDGGAKESEQDKLVCEVMIRF
ncbi:MAG: porin [Prevotella sp.]|mgnify:CR=1 FL=1|nr:OprO/OprP family phosphate-selective porin [Bacteroidales bacterium]MDY3673710.1 porin [Prevotella sp.]MDY4431669.1 porin [Prevotella sp.]